MEFEWAQLAQSKAKRIGRDRAEHTKPVTPVKSPISGDKKKIRKEKKKKRKNQRGL